MVIAVEDAPPAKPLGRQASAFVSALAAVGPVLKQDVVGR